jgi:hypothetical protein
MHADVLPYEKQWSSQNFEDGIIECMLDHLLAKNHVAIEIGSGNGVQNMIRNLVENHHYQGIGHDANAAVWHHERYQHQQGWIQLSALQQLVHSWPTMEPDFFSLDIDSIDFWVMKQLLELGFRPRLICAEYLCYYGPDLVCSVKPDLDSYPVSCCGCSLSAYQTLLDQYGYRFWTCDSHGVNCFFYLQEQVKPDIQSLPRHEWAFFSKYRKYTNIDLLDPRLEFDPERLFA